MNRLDLQKNNINYSEQPEDSDLPLHVVILRRALLDFRCTIPERLGFYEEEDYDDNQALKSRLKELGLFQRNDIVDSIKKYQATRILARGYDEGQDREAEWQSFFMNRFLKPLSDQMAIKEDDSRRVSRAKYYYESFEYAENRPWPLFTDAFREEYEQTGLSVPRPGRVAYFPIYDLSRSSDRIGNPSNRWFWNERAVDGIIHNFSCTILQKLADCGLEPSPAAIFRKDRNESIVSSDCICYPWMIVEHKKHEYKNAEECYCQAVNATTGALVMLRILSRYRNADEVIPPVVAITTVGRDVSVWISYVDDNMDQYRMACIWKGDMTRITDIVKFEAILENLHTWAMRVLRPWISHYIDQWRSKHQIDLPRVPDNDDDPSPSAGIVAEQLSALVMESLPMTSQELPQNEEEMSDNMKSSIGTELEDLFEKVNTLVQRNTERVIASVSNRGARSYARSISTQTEPSFSVHEPLLPDQPLNPTLSNSVSLSGEPGRLYAPVGSLLTDTPQTAKWEGSTHSSSNPNDFNRQSAVSKSNSRILPGSFVGDGASGNMARQTMISRLDADRTIDPGLRQPGPVLFGISTLPKKEELPPGLGLFGDSAPSKKQDLPLGTGLIGSFTLPKREDVPLRTGLFGSSTPLKKQDLPPGLGWFGSSTLNKEEDASRGTGLFGSSAPPKKQNLPPGPGLFGSSALPKKEDILPGSGLFGSATLPKKEDLPPGSGLFGSYTLPKKEDLPSGPSLFGISTLPKKEDLPPGSGLFGSSTLPKKEDLLPGSGLFGSYSLPKIEDLPPGPGLFGSSTLPKKGDLPPGSGLFGTSTLPKIEDLPPGPGLFGNSTPSRKQDLPTPFDSRSQEKETLNLRADVIGTLNENRDRLSVVNTTRESSMANLAIDGLHARTVALFRSGSKNDIMKFLEKQNEDFQVTDDVLRAAAENRKHGRDVMEILLKERGGEVRITEGVLRAVLKNVFNRQSIIKLLLDQRRNEVQVTADLVRVLISTSPEPQLITQLLDIWGDDTHISQDMLELAAKGRFNGRETVRLLMQRSRGKLKITDDVVLSVVKNENHGERLIQTLLEEREDEVHITQDVVQAAAANETAGTELMQVILERCGSQFKITEKVLQAAAGNSMSGPRIILLLLEQRPGEVVVTRNVLIAAHRNRISGADIIALLMQGE